MAAKKPWSASEDEALRDAHASELAERDDGAARWSEIAKSVDGRSGKQCRERWRNHLRPQLNKGEWSVQEDIDIWDKVQEMGPKWAQISELYMSQRTDNDIKNRWNSIIRKQQHPAGRVEPLHADGPHALRAQIFDEAVRDRAHLPPVRAAADEEAVAVVRLARQLEVHDVLGLSGICGARQRERQVSALDDATSGNQDVTTMKDVTTT
jgi:hypothetical protein